MLAGLLGSAFDGERLNALAMLQRMADTYKVRIDELLLAQHPDQPTPDAPQLPSEWRDDFIKVQELNRSLFFLTTWETNFVADLIACGTRWPSPKQAVVIIRILEIASTFSTTADWEDLP